MTWQVRNTLLSITSSQRDHTAGDPSVPPSPLAALLALQFTTCRLISTNDALADSLVRDQLFDKLGAGGLLLPTYPRTPFSVPINSRLTGVLHAKKLIGGRLSVQSFSESPHNARYSALESNVKSIRYMRSCNVIQ